MSITRFAAGLAVAGVALLAPGAQATFPISTCDSVRCFAEWCANNTSDCVDGEPFWYYCDDRGCFGGRGDITRYVAYCTVIAGPVACIK